MEDYLFLYHRHSLTQCPVTRVGPDASLSLSYFYINTKTSL